MADSNFIDIDLRDARFFRAHGAFRFVAHGASGEARVLLEEQAADVGSRAGPGHPKWAWALANGMSGIQIQIAST